MDEETRQPVTGSRKRGPNPTIPCDAEPPGSMRRTHETARDQRRTTGRKPAGKRVGGGGLVRRGESDTVLSAQAASVSKTAMSSMALGAEADVLSHRSPNSECSPDVRHSKPERSE